MLRLFGVRSITKWSGLQKSIAFSFSKSRLIKSEPNEKPKLPKPDRKKIPLKKRPAKVGEDELEALLKSTGIDKILEEPAQGSQGVSSEPENQLLEEQNEPLSNSTSKVSQPVRSKPANVETPQAEQNSDSFSPLRLLTLLSEVDHKYCRGCGARFQFEIESKEGYVDLGRLEKSLQKHNHGGIDPDQPETYGHVLRALISERKGSGGISNKLRVTQSPVNASSPEDLDELDGKPVKEKAKEQLEDGFSEMYSIEDYLNDTIGLENIKEVEDLFEDKIVQKDICDRCVSLKNGDVDKIKSIEIPVSHFVTNLFRKIAKGSIVIVVVDISDLEGTVPTPFLDHLASGNYEVFVVANKMDTLPETISKEKVKGWLTTRLRQLLPNVALVRLVNSRITNT